MVSRHGRDVGCPTPPAQTPACSFPAQGSSEILASAVSLNELKVTLVINALCNPRFFNVMTIEQCIELTPVKALSLTSSIQPFVQNSTYLSIILLDAFKVIDHTIVIIVATQFAAQRFH